MIIKQRENEWIESDIWEKWNWEFFKLMILTYFHYVAHFNCFAYFICICLND